MSHLHGDHLHLRSPAKLAPNIPVVPRGALRAVSRLRPLGRSDVVGPAAGEELQVGALQIRAVPARHGFGPGHLTAERAVQAALAVGAGSAIRIHYGTLSPVGRCELIRPREFNGPGPEFARQAMAQEPAPRVGRLRPGQTDRFEPVP